MIGGRVQAVFSAAKVVLIAAFVVAAMVAGTGDWSHFAARDGGVGAHLFTNTFAVQLIFVSYAYSGWNAAAYIAGEIDAPRKNVPRALLAGTGLVMALYLLLNVVFIYALAPEQLAPAGQKFPVIEVGDAAARALFSAHTADLISTLTTARCRRCSASAPGAARRCSRSCCRAGSRSRSSRSARSAA